MKKKVENGQKVNGLAFHFLMVGSAEFSRRKTFLFGLKIFIEII
jgi:hypothetical protein